MSANAPDATTSVAEALIAAYKEAYPDAAESGTRLTHPVASMLAVHGWTTETVHQVARLAEHSRDAFAWIAIAPYTLGDPPTRPSSQDVAKRILTLAGNAAYGGASCADLLPWLAVWASDPSRERSDRLKSLIDTWYRLGDWTRSSPQHTPPAAWIEQVGPLAALAYAAGLDIAEAATHQCAGTLDSDRLRTMAALRGYRLPSVL